MTLLSSLKNLLTGGAQTIAGAKTFTSDIIMANTKGIDFSATANGTGTVTSEILVDYEEGTWSPLIGGDATQGTYTYEAARTGARYTKIGRVVHVWGSIRITGTTSAGSGNAAIYGLPFGVGANISTSWGNASNIGVTQYNGTLSNATYPRPLVAVSEAGPGTTFLTIYAAGSTGGRSATTIAIAAYVSGTDIMEFAGTYTV